MNIKAESEVALPVIYRGEKVQGEGFRIDLLVEDTIIVEVKSVNKLKDVH